MKERIKKVMESQHMTQQVFAQFLEISPASLSSIFNDRTKPTLQIVEAIKRKIPTISTEWLLFGQGDMFGNQYTANEVDQNGGYEPEQSTLSLTSDANIEQDLFAQNSNQQNNNRQMTQSNYGVRDTRLHNHHASYAVEVKNSDKIERKITEIRVYFDDQTFETFVPSK